MLVIMSHDSSVHGEFLTDLLTVFFTRTTWAGNIHEFSGLGTLGTSPDWDFSEVDHKLNSKRTALCAAPVL